MSPCLRCALPALLALQEPRASLEGVVRDGSSGAPIQGALVVLVDLDRTAVTSNLGRYRLTAVPAGPQHLSIRRLGYAPRAMHALVPSAGTLTIDVVLEAVPLRLQTVEVRDTPPARGTEFVELAPPDRYLTVGDVRHHPLLAEPDAFRALGGGLVALHPEAPSGLHVRGAPSDQTAYALDGIPVFSPYHAAGVFSAWNPDALEGVRLVASLPSPTLPPALGGVVEGVTLTPGSRPRAQGSVSTTQARVTLDGTLHGSRIGYLLSAREGFPGLLAPRDEPSYVRGETSDLLGKLERPAFGGRAWILGYVSENELSPASRAHSDAAAVARHGFEWWSGSLGAGFSRTRERGSLRLLAWRARGDAVAHWRPTTETIVMSSGRLDHGVLAAVDVRIASVTATVGVRGERSETTYEVQGDSSPIRRRDRVISTTLFAQSVWQLTRRAELQAGTSLSMVGDDLRLAPRMRVALEPSHGVELSLSYARIHQLAQSQRNTESLAGLVFPADLFVGVREGSDRIASSDQVVVQARVQPVSGAALAAQAYHRNASGVRFAAPTNDAPFATDRIASGTSIARGASLDASFGGARISATASYGFHWARNRAAGQRWIPEYGTAHQVSGGATLFPDASWSVRAGTTLLVGRRGSASAGAFEWESCNLVDEGCEFGGSPLLQPASLGTMRLPAYARVDVGIRRHWHVSVAGRQALLALFGSVTNILDRRNVLAYVTDDTGRPVPIEMGRVAPLVVGLDWRLQ